MLVPRHRTLPRILFVMIIVLSAACTSVPTPTPYSSPDVAPTLTSADTPETVWPTCIPMLQKSYPFSAIWSPADSTVALITVGGICLYDAATLRDLRFIETGIFWRLDTVFSPNGKLLAARSAANIAVINLWDVATGRKLHTFEAGYFAFAPDSQVLATSSADIRLWDVGTGRKLRVLSGGNIEGLSFSPDGTLLTPERGVAKLWEVSTGREIPLPESKYRVFAPDNKTLALAGGNENTAIQLWDLPTGRIRQTLRGHTAEVERLVFSPDGQILASSARWPHDKTIRVWDVQSGQELYSLEGHSYVILDVAFSPDGRTLASSDCCTPLRLWNVQTGREWFPDKNWDVNDILRFSPEGKPLQAPGKVLNFNPSTQESVSFSADGQRRISRSLGAPEHHSSPQFFELSDVATGHSLPLVNGVFQTISLDMVANADTPFPSQSSSQVSLATSWPGVPGTGQLRTSFELTPRVFKSQATASPSDTYPTAAQLSMDIPNAYRVYLALNTEKSPREFKGKTIGQVTVTCGGTRVMLADLRLGVNVGDWNSPDVRALPTPGVEAWASDFSSYRDYHIGSLSLNLPPVCWSGHLAQIEISDTSRDTVGSLDPGLVLAGVTVESRAPAQ